MCRADGQINGVGTTTSFSLPHLLMMASQTLMKRNPTTRSHANLTTQNFLEHKDFIDLHCTVSRVDYKTYSEETEERKSKTKSAGSRNCQELPGTAFAGVWLQDRLHLLQEAKGQGSNTRLAAVTGLSLRMFRVCDK